MPHFGLMDEDALGPEMAALQRARLHIRGGRRRLTQGKVAYGIITLYDALLHAMNWHILSRHRNGSTAFLAGEDSQDEKTLYTVLVRSGVLDGTFDFAGFEELVDRAVGHIRDGTEAEMSGYPYGHVLQDIVTVMTRLGVMPFDEDSLPPEDPSTF